MIPHFCIYPPLSSNDVILILFIFVGPCLPSLPWYLAILFILYLPSPTPLMIPHFWYLTVLSLLVFTLRYTPPQQCQTSGILLFCLCLYLPSPTPLMMSYFWYLTVLSLLVFTLPYTPLQCHTSGFLPFWSSLYLTSPI